MTSRVETSLTNASLNMKAATPHASRPISDAHRDAIVVNFMRFLSGTALFEAWHSNNFLRRRLEDSLFIVSAAFRSQLVIGFRNPIVVIRLGAGISEFLCWLLPIGLLVGISSFIPGSRTYRTPEIGYAAYIHVTSANLHAFDPSTIIAFLARADAVRAQILFQHRSQAKELIVDKMMRARLGGKCTRCVREITRAADLFDRLDHARRDRCPESGDEVKFVPTDDFRTQLVYLFTHQRSFREHLRLVDAFDDSTALVDRRTLPSRDAERCLPRVHSRPLNNPTSTRRWQLNGGLRSSHGDAVRANSRFAAKWSAPDGIAIRSKTAKATPAAN